MTEETPCPKRDDGQHCNCWYDGEACCACGDPAARSGMISTAPRLTNEEDTKALWLTRRLMPQEPER